jgi:hypothetical protein
MNITLQLILDELGYEYESFLGSGANPAFAGVELLAAHGSDLSGRKLLVCPLSEALAMSEVLAQSIGQAPPQMLPLSGREGGGVCFLCIRDRMVDASETPEAMRGISIVKRNIDLKELFNEVQRIFTRISDWIIAMQRSVMADEGIQALITLSEGIIGNYISVMDPTFKLLAYTKNIETDDSPTNAMVRDGYHSEETVRQMRLHQRFAEYEENDGVIVSDDFAISKYVTVKKAFHSRGSYTILVVMLCNEKPHTGGLLDLFDMLLANVQVYVNREYPPEGDASPAKALICDMLERKVAGEEEARARAATAGLAFESDYDLFFISFDDIANTPLSRLVQSLSGLMPNSHAFSYQRGILLLNGYEGVRVEGREARLEHVKGAIGGFSAWCGVSVPFGSLQDLPWAYEQTSSAIRLGLRLRKRAEAYTDIPDHGRLFFFEDYALFSQASQYMANARDGLRHTLSFGAIQKLAELGKNHQVPLIRILHTYLICERRATEACSRLHMHRNTVLYHINRIQEMLGVSLDDPEVRLKLLLGIKYREMEIEGSNVFSVGKDLFMGKE